MKYLYFLIFFTFLLPGISLAEHKSAVAGTVIDSNDSGIVGPDEGGCDQIHYHGILNGAPDPTPKGCGHGPVVIIPHGRGDGESLPYTPPTPSEPSTWSRFWSWVGSFFSDDTKETAKNVVDVIAESNGLPPPGTVSDAVDITKEETPAIIEKAEHIEEYRENIDPEEDTLNIYKDPSSGLEEGSVSQKFFRWFNGLID